MHFYFPINIDGRRLHCFNLQDVEAVKPKPLFSFIVKVTDNVSLLSIDSDQPQMISSEGLNHNQELVEHRFRVERIQETIENVPAYRIHIEKGRAVADVDDDSRLKSYGYMGAEDDAHHAVVKIDRSRALNNENHSIYEPVFIIIISFRYGDKVYEDAAKFYLYTEDQQLASAALDFGSEASQIRFGGNSANNPVIDTLLSIQNDAVDKEDEEYWQGKPGDSLYKSVFFIHTKPGTTKYADKPLVGYHNAFVQPLLKSTTRRDTYQMLELLPNLKLIEIGNGFVAFSSKRIEFGVDSNIEVGDTPNLSSQPLRESILRIILSNFLHCMLYDIGGSKQKDKFLRMVLMVPNVYYQSKIYSLMRGLYEDYSTIQADNSYPTCKGFEVQVVSESDAAFLGVKHTRRDIKNAKNGYFLIIDAGKGTTDFSILQQQECFANYSSLYRDGIPASGNVLTYAFYEALHAFMNAHGIELSSMLKSAEKSELLQFMNHLEQFKKDYKKSQEICEAPKKNNINSMANLNTYLLNESKKKHQIPNSEAYVDRKVKLLCESLELSMKYYMETKTIQFLQVLLTGRGFLFEPFKKAVIEMLLKNKWIKNNDSVIRINGDEAKTICLAGALAIEKECSVNCNSGLIGSPIIRQTTDHGNWFHLLRKRLFGKQGKAKEIDIDFFYQGSARIAAQNVTIVIGGREYPISSNNREDKALFYTGDGFICLKEDSCESIDERNFTFSDETISGLIMESLFPFYPGSIRDECDMSPICVDGTPRQIKQEDASEENNPSQDLKKDSGNDVDETFDIKQP